MEWTPILDQTLRDAYANNSYGSKVAAHLAQKFGCCAHQVLYRAVTLGLIRPRERYRWTQKELDMLEKYAHLSLDRIRKKLLKVSPLGCKRTASAVVAQIHNNRLHTNLDGRNGESLADAFGVSVHQIHRWRIAGMLKGSRIESIDQHHRKDPITLIAQNWFYSNKEVRNFVFLYPSAFDLRKVNQLWFLELMRAGTIQGKIDKLFIDEGKNKKRKYRRRLHDHNPAGKV